MAHNIATDCADCCACPSPTFFGEVKEGGGPGCGFSAWLGGIPLYRLATFNGTNVSVGEECTQTESWSGSASCSGDSECEGVVTASTVVITCTDGSSSETGGGTITIDECYIDPVLFPHITIDSETTAHLTTRPDMIITLSDPWTSEETLDYALASLGSFTGVFSDIPETYFFGVLPGAIELSVCRYIVRFPLPPNRCYRVHWVERFIPDAGVSLTSAEIITRGVFRPTATATGGGGSGCVLICRMGSAGDVTAVDVLNPGTGYTSPPTITIQTAIGGGTTSTGWLATLSGNGIGSVARTGGSAGNYLPTGAFSGGGGSGATITFTLDEMGGLATCPLGSGGSAYAAAPLLTITPKVSGSLASLIHLHLGTETEKCSAWDGVKPEDYDPMDGNTWPTLPSASPGYFEMNTPESEGLTKITNVRAYCDCSACPE